MTLLEVALVNTALALPLAAIAWGSGWLRRPTVTHCLWMLMLLRLFMPPIWQVAWPEWPAGRGGEPRSAAGAIAASPLEMNSAPRTVLAPVAAEISPNTSMPVALAEIDNCPLPANFAWQIVAGVIWMTGAIAVVGLAIVRGVAFHRLLRGAELAPAAWQRTTDRLSRRIGVRRVPRVFVIRGVVSPMLWAGFSRPRILFPLEFADRLDGRRRAALLAHELAHLRRGDHWARWLELMATAVYWWHPLLWLARRGLREAEEQCCDAWVVWALPGGRRAYADALVDTVDFLCCSRPALPPLASGLGTVRHLKRRVVMIMCGKAARRLSRPGLLVGLVLGTAMLAIMPTWGQDRPPSADDDGPAPPSPRPRVEAREATPRPSPRRSNEVADLREEIKHLRTQLYEAERRLAQVEGRPTLPPPDPRSDFPRGATTGHGLPTTPPIAAAPESPDRLPAPPRAPAPPSALPVPAVPAPRDPLVPPSAARPADTRMDDLERELAELRRDIALMRREMRRPDARPAPDAPKPTPRP